MSLACSFLPTDMLPFVGVALKMVSKCVVSIYYMPKYVQGENAVAGNSWCQDWVDGQLLIGAVIWQDTSRVRFSKRAGTVSLFTKCSNIKTKVSDQWIGKDSLLSSEV